MSEEHQNISRENLCSSDFLASFLINELHFSPFWFALLAALIGTIFSILIALITKTLYFSDPSPGKVGLFNDWLAWVMILAISPCISGSYLWSFQAIKNLLQELVLSNIITINESDINCFIFNLYRQKWRKFVASIIAIFSGTCVSYILPMFKNYWTGCEQLCLRNIATTIGTLIVVYMTVIFLLNLVNNIWILRTIVTEEDIKINPFHPDGCGGLRFLSKYSFKMAYIAIILGFWLGAIQYQIWS